MKVKYVINIYYLDGKLVLSLYFFLEIGKKIFYLVLVIS